jgi:hypothetical protein
VLVKRLLTSIRVLPATPPRKSYNAMHLELQGLPKPLETMLGDTGDCVGNSGKIIGINQLTPQIQF